MQKSNEFNRLFLQKVVWLSLRQVIKVVLFGQQNITLKYMSMFNDTNNSINEILEMLKNYRTEGKPKQSSFQQASHSTTQRHDQSSLANISYRPTEQSTSAARPVSSGISQKNGLRLRLHSSLEHISNRKGGQSSTESSNIFRRLYEEDKALRQKRQQLFVSGRRQQQDQERRQCTFSPHLRHKSGKSMTQDEVEGFYQKNINWQQKVHKEIKLKQCQKINEGVSNLTFTPKINTRKDKINKENVPLLEKKGVEQFLQRQQKVNHCIETLESRKKNPYTQIWNFKKSQFSYLH